MTVLLGQSILGATGTDFELSGVQIGSFWICTQDGIVDSVTIRTDTGTTATSLECAIFADNGTNPTTQIGNVSTTPLSNGVVNRQTTGGMEARVYRGVRYWIMFCVLGGGQFQFRTFNGNNGAGGTTGGTKDGPSGGGLTHIQTPFSLQSTFNEVIWCFADGQAIDRKRYLPRKVGPIAGPSFLAGLQQPPVIEPAGGTTFNQDLIADTVTTSATTQLQTGKGLTATVTATASLARQAAKTVTASTVALTSTIVRQVAKPLTASTVAVTASIVAQKVILKTLTATSSLTASITRQVGKPLTATTVALTATLVRQARKPLTATVTVTASQTAQKVILRTLTATISVSASLVKQAAKPLTASTITATPSLVKQAGKRLTATTITATASLTSLKVILRTLTANTITVTATAVRQIGKPLPVTVNVTPSIVKQTGKQLSRTVTVTATMLAQRVFLRALTATVTASATIRRSTGKLLTAPATLTATVAKRVAKTVSAVVTAGAALAAEITGGQPIGHIDGRGSAGSLDEGSSMVFALVNGRTAETTVDNTTGMSQMDEAATDLTGRID